MKNNYYILTLRNSELYGLSIRADIGFMTFEQLSLFLKNSFSFLAYGYSQDGRPAFIEVATNKEIESKTFSELKTALNNAGYFEKGEIYNA